MGQVGQVTGSDHVGAKSEPKEAILSGSGEEERREKKEERREWRRETREERSKREERREKRETYR